MAQIVNQAYIKQAYIIPKEDTLEASHCLRVWKRYARICFQSKHLDKTSLYIYRDFQLVTKLLQNDMLKIKKDPLQRLIIVKDNFSYIQAMLSLKIETSEFCEPKIYVCHLVTAPWNLRLNIKVCDPPLRGAGVVALVASVIFAHKIGASSISLSSTPTAAKFYEKLGMKKEGFNRFTMDLGKKALEPLIDYFCKIKTLTTEAGEKLAMLP
jgi:hypothetical protein